MTAIEVGFSVVTAALMGVLVSTSIMGFAAKIYGKVRPLTLAFWAAAVSAVMLTVSMWGKAHLPNVAWGTIWLLAAVLTPFAAAWRRPKV